MAIFYSLSITCSLDVNANKMFITGEIQGNGKNASRGGRRRPNVRKVSVPLERKSRFAVHQSTVHVYFLYDKSKNVQINIMNKRIEQKTKILTQTVDHRQRRCEGVRERVNAIGRQTIRNVVD